MVCKFLAVPDARCARGSSLNHCRGLRIIKFPASMSANYISGNITIPWAINFVANVLTFWGVLKVIWVWGNLLNHCRHTRDNFPARISAKNTAGNNYLSISCCEETFQTTTDALEMIFRPGFLQKYTASPNYLTISCCEETLPTTADALKINFRPGFLQKYTASNNYLTISCCKILDCSKGILSVGKTFWSTADGFWITFPQHSSGTKFTISCHLNYGANSPTFWGVPKVIRVWNNIVNDCRPILDSSIHQENGLWPQVLLKLPKATQVALGIQSHKAAQVSLKDTCL